MSSVEGAAELPLAAMGKYHDLVGLLRKAGRGAVAFSGGVDSTLLLKASVAAYGADAVAFHVHSRVQKQAVLEVVRQTCRELGCALRIVELDLLSWPEFTANSAARCYHCKKNIYTCLTSLLVSGYKLFDGTNTDDLRQDRPGLQAVRELGVRMPLLEAGLTKREIRSLCRGFHLAGWDLPSESCLATRIAAGVTITPELLQHVEYGENFLAAYGFSGCRVRLDGKSVFITLSQVDSIRLLGGALRDEVIKFFLKLNYAKVFLELSERPGMLTRY